MLENQKENPAPEHGHDEEDEEVRYEEEHHESYGYIKNPGGDRTERGSRGIELRSTLGKGDDTGVPAYPGRDHSSHGTNQTDVAAAFSDAEEDDISENMLELLDPQKVGMNNPSNQIILGPEQSHQGAVVGKFSEDANADHGDEESATPQPTTGTEHCESDGM